MTKTTDTPLLTAGVAGYIADHLEKWWSWDKPELRALRAIASGRAVVRPATDEGADEGMRDFIKMLRDKAALDCRGMYAEGVADGYLECADALEARLAQPHHPTQEDHPSGQTVGREGKDE